ncbi:TrbI/VirB10 family protein [Lonepinella sp. BR2882]|uniref:TrbI/VirB10 family protein n=1 Tax=Lonepinella sp. BR2882 TaxID=3095283 RepID=UPI003F6DC136
MSDNNNNGQIADIEDNQSIVTNARNDVSTGINRKGGKAVKAAFAIVAGLIAFAGLAMTFLNFDNKEETVEVKKDEALQEQGYNQNTLASTMAEIKRKEEEEAARRKAAEEAERRRKEQEERDRLAQEKQEQQLQQVLGGDGQGQQPIQAPQKQYTPAQRKLEGDTLVNLGKSGGGRNAQSQGGGENDIDGMLAGSVYPNGSTKIVQNHNLLLIHGTQIPCALQTRIVTDQPSIIICQITKNIYSADGTTLLIERGSKVFGEQKKAIITGQNMAFVNWSEVDTPNGIRIRIDSLGTDSLGASGINVWVDEKWGKRLGGAVLLTFIQDALATASQKISDSTVVYENSENNTGRMAEIALQNSISIQPTGYALQGQLVNILVARDVDFSDVYSVR